MPVLTISYYLIIGIIIMLLFIFTIVAVWLLAWIQKNNTDGFYDEIADIRNRIAKAKETYQLDMCEITIHGLYITFQTTRFHPDIEKEVTMLLERLHRRKSVIAKNSKR